MTKGARNAEYRGHVLGRPCHIIADSTDDDTNPYIMAAVDELARLERKFSAHHPDSIVYQINQQAGTGRNTALDAETTSLFKLVSALWQESRHQFDPTLQLVHHCYGSGTPAKGYRSRISRLLPGIGWDKLSISEEGASLTSETAILDLNSCIRPHAVDSAIRAMKKAGASSAMVDLNSDRATLGKQPDGSNWLCGIRYPRGKGGAISRIKLNGAGFSIRGDYEQSLSIDGERYSRAVSPIDGLPVPGLLTVAVVGDRAIDAFGATTVARFKTEPAALEWLSELGLPWFAIDRVLNCHGPLIAN
jgi:thiamine biosynthesis lipoprotein